MTFELGWNRDIEDARDRKYEASSVRESRIIDLRTKLPPAYAQGNAKNCVANAVAAAFSYATRNNPLVTGDPSRLYIYYHARRIENSSNIADTGSTIRNSLKAVASNGVSTEDAWPYDVSKVNLAPSADADKAGDQDILINYQSVSQKLGDILSCLTNNGPVIFGTDVFESIMGEECLETGFIPAPTESDVILGGHAMLIVGWQPDSQHFIVRNSWGPVGSNQSGYFAMPAGYVLDPELAADFWTIVSTP